MSGHQIGFWKHKSHDDKVYAAKQATRRWDTITTVLCYAPFVIAAGSVLGILTYRIVYNLLTWPR